MGKHGGENQLKFLYNIYYYKNWHNANGLIRSRFFYKIEINSFLYISH